MTLVSLPSPIYWPGLTGSVTGGGTLATTATLDAAGEYVSYAFSAREDMVVSHVGFRAGTATGSPTCTVGIETVDATGFPAGAAGFGSTNGTTATISSNTWVLTALGGSATISKGSIFCVKIAYASGTSQVVQQCNSVVLAAAYSLPYRIINTGTPTRSVIDAHIPLVALGSSSTAFYQIPGVIPMTAFSAGGFNNTNSAKRGLRFVPPMDCRAAGVRWYNTNSTGDYNIVLYDDAGTELSSSSTAVDGDHNGAGTFGAINAHFDNAVTLAAGTAYRIAVEPTSATNVNVSTITLPSSDYFSATPAGTTAVYATFATATWTDSTTQLPLMDLIIDQVDDGTGSGSGGGGQRVISG
jgi:hypothetical protein